MRTDFAARYFRFAFFIPLCGYPCRKNTMTAASVTAENSRMSVPYPASALLQARPRRPLTPEMR